MSESTPPPSAPSQPAGTPPNVGLALGLAIAATVLCCLPTGIAAIIFAAQGMSASSAGDYALAEEKRKKSMMWTYISAGVWAVLAILYVIFFLIVGVGAAAGAGAGAGGGGGGF